MTKSRRNAASPQQPYALCRICCVWLWLAIALAPGSVWTADCNGNGLDDAEEVAGGSALDCNTNFNPDECDVPKARFSTSAGVPVRAVPFAVAIADLNGDSIMDVVTGNFQSPSSSLSLLFGDGDRNFTRVDYDLEARLSVLRLADLDGDGESDVITRTSRVLQLLYNEGGGTLSTPEIVRLASGAVAVEVGDVDGDGLPDLLVTHSSSNTVSLLRNQGSRSFAEAVSIPTGASPVDLALSDLDGDGDLDFVTANRSSSEVAILDNDGNGGFVDTNLKLPVSRPTLVETQDLDADGRPDVVVAAEGRVVTFLQDDTGSFGAPSEFLTEGVPSSLVVADVTGDEIPDVLTLRGLSSTVLVMVGAGDGTFPASFAVALSDASTAIGLGDLDGDADPEIVAVGGTDAMTVLWNGEDIGVSLLSETIAMPPAPHSASIGDIDGDGDLDVVTADGNGMTITTFANNGRGTLALAGIQDVRGYLNSITTADFDRDGDLDAATVAFREGFVQVHFNDGTGTFTNKLTYMSGSQVFFVTHVDLDGDSILDLITTNEGQNDFARFRGNGDGTFEPLGNVTAGSRPRAAATADFDGDGDVDVAIANAGATTFGLMVFAGDGRGSFPDAPIEYDVDSPNYVVAADLNGDGRPDLVTANDIRLTYSVLMNESSGGFGAPVTRELGQRPYSLITADVNLDGTIDLVTANEASRSISVVPNHGDGTFAPAVHFTAGIDPRFVLAGDLDGDLDLELVAANHTSRDITVFENQLEVSGEPFLPLLCTPVDFENVSRAASASQPGVRRFTKFTVPVDPDDPSLVPPLVQNVNRFSFHEDFLESTYPDQFPPGTYNELVNVRATRKYFVGVLFLLNTDMGPIFGFNVLGNFTSDLSELPTPEEVRRVFEALSGIFTLAPLYYYPDQRVTREDAATWVDPGFDIFLDDPAANIPFIPYTQGVGFGRVRLLAAAEFEAANDSGLISFEDILVLERAPRDIEGVVSGVITAEPQGELSHVAIRTARRGTPNAFVRSALEEFATYRDQLVRLEVTAGAFRVEPATLEEAQAWWQSSRPVISVLPTIDAEFSDLPTLDEIAAIDAAVKEPPAVSRFGGKASNFARLQSILTGEMARYRARGFAIPMRYYLDFMRTNHIASAVDPARIVTYEEYLSELFADPEFQSDSRRRFELLDRLRDHMDDDSSIPSELVARLAQRIEDVFGTTTLRFRFRSSSNVEDALEFNGAGLYDSTSACAADDLDGDAVGPSLCDPERENERGIGRALRKVWQSLWNFRAHEERTFFSIPPETAAMGVLVSRAFPDELANGVAFTGNPSNALDRRYVVTVQIGENSVVSPEPGELPEKDILTVVDGVVTDIVRAVPSSLLPIGEDVMTDAQLEELGALLWHMDQTFPLQLGDVPRQQVLLDAEFKIDSEGRLAVKQVRPFLLSGPAQPTPTFELQIPPGAAACVTFNGVKLLAVPPERVLRQAKSTVTFIPGTVSLPTRTETFSGELFAEVRRSGGDEVLSSAGPGEFRVRRRTEGETTTYAFRYTQEFTTADDAAYVLVLDNLLFRAIGDEPLERSLLFDEEFITRTLQLEGNSIYPYASCDDDLLPLWEITAELDDGLSLRLLERFEPPPDINLTGPASLVRATIDIGDEVRQVDDYWHLVYAADRHNQRIHYWAVLDPPLPMAGLERPIHVVAVETPDFTPQAPFTVTYLDENLMPIHSPGVLRSEKRLAETEARFRRGDLDADGNAALADAVAILNYLFRAGSAPRCQKAADANDDGRLNVTDAISVLLHSFAGAGALPAPFVTCGTDPTPDDLECTTSEACAASDQ